jgi:5-(carboxyamino)imidazole ribonucleotide synthase
MQSIGIIGGGQLAAMMIESILPWGIPVKVFGTSPDDPCHVLTPDFMHGDLSDVKLIGDFFQNCQVVTFEHEWMTPEVLYQLESEYNLNFAPSAKAFVAIENKLKERSLYRELDIPSPDWIFCADANYGEFQKQLAVFLKKDHASFYVKYIKGAYDGKGTIPISGKEELLKFLKQASGEFLIESTVNYERELAVLVARSTSEMVFYDPIETIQNNNICHYAQRAENLDSSKLEKLNHYCQLVMEKLDYQGLACFEFFETKNEVLINEMAPRPHNSGHLTIEACQTSQFQNHLRAVMNLKLGDTGFIHPQALMKNILGSKQRLSAWNYQALESLNQAQAYWHFYGKKEEKPGRKMGHITFLKGKPSGKTEWEKLDQINILSGE